MSSEFKIIEQYFRPLTNGDMLHDDAAVLCVPAGYDLIVTSDTLNAGTHFLEDETPENIARKALRTNLSDLASMGARPLSYQLNLAFPQKPSGEWLAAFTGALSQDQAEFGVFCSGGDTTSILGDYLSISITALGLVPVGKALRRDKAKTGDLLMISGPVGDAYLGLKSIRKGLGFTLAETRYRIPYPRLGSVHLLDAINAAADISDGLIADAGHIARASCLGLEISLNEISFSNEILSAIDKGIIIPAQALTGGDDYELAMAVNPEMASVVRSIFPKAQIIGKFVNGQGVTVRDENGAEVQITTSGWTHF